MSELSELSCSERIRYREIMENYDIGAFEEFWKQKGIFTDKKPKPQVSYKTKNVYIYVPKDSTVRVIRT